MGLLPDHHDVLTALLNLCNNAITECEAELEQQKASDMAEAMWLEEQKARENEARMLAEQQEKERREKIEKRQKDRLEIEAAERDLAAKKEALQNESDDDEEDEEEEEGSESGAEEHPVSLSVKIFTVFYPYSNQQLCQDTSKTKAQLKRELDEEAHKKAPQTNHGVVSVPL